VGWPVESLPQIAVNVAVPHGHLREVSSFDELPPFAVPLELVLRTSTVAISDCARKRTAGSSPTAAYLTLGATLTTTAFTARIS
jgi:hypothetical protein